MNTAVFYNSKLPSRRLFPDESVLFYDLILLKNAQFRKWSRSFKYRISLKAGETLKDLKSFNILLQKLADLPIEHSTKLTFVAVGGGSVGDVVGFLASVYQRGRPLVLIPSTWLAAVDSSHGGKNGLNFGGVKNQIGSFYSPEAVFICADLLGSQPAERANEAMGEIIKIAIIAGSKLFNRVDSSGAPPEQSKLFDMLHSCVREKYRVVKKDPFEKNGHRRLLNLGHTMGHVFESQFKLSHGTAVLYGMQFSIRWSYVRGLLGEKDFARISHTLETYTVPGELNRMLGYLRDSHLKKLLAKDKKTTGKSQIDFIFVKSVGSCVREKVSPDEILTEVGRQISEY